jgi:hypothetical protein
MRSIVGRRVPRPTVVVREDGQPDRPLKHYLKHSPDGFEWGYGGSGPADLAYAILREVFSMDPKAEELARKYYQRFKMLIVARLPRAQFDLLERDVREAVAKIVEDEISGKLTR